MNVEELLERLKYTRDEKEREYIKYRLREYVADNNIRGNELRKLAHQVSVNISQSETPDSEKIKQAKSFIRDNGSRVGMGYGEIFRDLPYEEQNTRIGRAVGRLPLDTQIALGEYLRPWSPWGDNDAANDIATTIHKRRATDALIKNYYQGQQDILRRHPNLVESNIQELAEPYMSKKPQLLYGPKEDRNYSLFGKRFIEGKTTPSSLTAAYNKKMKYSNGNYNGGQLGGMGKTLGTMAAIGIGGAMLNNKAYAAPQVEPYYSNDGSVYYDPDYDPLDTYF